MTCRRSSTPRVGALVAGAALALISPAARAGELRDYSFPSERMQAFPQQQMAVPPPAPASGAAPSQYDDFARKVAASNLTSEQRTQLLDSLRGRAREALDAGRDTDARYYLGLVQRLEAGR